MDTKIDQRRAEESYPDPNPHLTTLTAPATTSIMDMTSYSQAVTSYPHDLHPATHQPHYYHGEYDWQHGGSAAAGGGAGGSDPGHAAFYGFGERPDLSSVPLYHSYPSQVHSADLFAASPALWHHAPPAMVEDHGHVNALASQRYLSSMARGSGPSSASSSSSSPTTSSSGKPKRKRVQSHTQRKAANIRERRRMFHLNSAFDELRKRLPAFNYEKRLSRIETLRLAMTYIGFMKDVTLGEDPRKVKLRPGMSDSSSDLSHLELESVTSEEAQQEDAES